VTTNLATLSKKSLKSLIEQHEGDAWPLQGNPEKGVVVLRFPSEEAVRDFVNDPEYQPAKELRIAVTTNANAVHAPKFQMPEG
jgi:uncharacterized protein (DUF1330 family)